jgi:hypothetical protein
VLGRVSATDRTHRELLIPASNKDSNNQRLHMPIGIRNTEWSGVNCPSSPMFEQIRPRQLIYDARKYIQFRMDLLLVISLLFPYCFYTLVVFQVASATSELELSSGLPISLLNLCCFTQSLRTNATMAHCTPCPATF